MTAPGRAYVQPRLVRQKRLFSNFVIYSSMFFYGYYLLTYLKFIR